MEINTERLRRFRQHAGKSVPQLAIEAGIARSHLYYIEKGERRPGEGVTKKLADALGVKVEELMPNG